MTTPQQARLTVHRGTDRLGQYSWSPFVTKVEIRLRLSRLSYACGAGGPVAGPRGKIPWIRLSLPGHEPETLSDSSLISKTLIKKGVLDDLNAPLNAKEKGLDLAIRAMLEEKLFFYNVRERWVDNFITMRDYSLAKMPLPQRSAAGETLYRANVQKLHDQGTGRFTDDEIQVFRKEIWQSVNSFLEDSQKTASSDECFWVLGGQNPTEADATVYGFIVSTLVAESGPISKQLVKAECPAAIDYASRIHHRYFAEYEMWS